MRKEFACWSSPGRMPGRKDIGTDGLTLNSQRKNRRSGKWAQSTWDRGSPGT